MLCDQDMFIVEMNVEGLISLINVGEFICNLPLHSDSNLLKLLFLNLKSYLVHLYDDCNVDSPETNKLLKLSKGTKLHFKSPTAERRHVWCVGVGGDTKLV